MPPITVHSITAKTTATMEDNSSNYLVPWKVPSGCADVLTALTILHAIYLLEWKLYVHLVDLASAQTVEKVEDKLEQIICLFYELDDIELFKCINKNDLVPIKIGNRDTLLSGAFFEQAIQDRDGVDLLPWCVRDRHERHPKPVSANIRIRSIEALICHIEEVFRSDGWTYHVEHGKVKRRLGFVSDRDFYDMLCNAERCRQTARFWTAAICENPEKASTSYRTKISFFSFHHCRALHRMLYDGNVSCIGSEEGIQVEDPTQDLNTYFARESEKVSLGKAVLTPFRIEKKAGSLMGFIAAVLKQHNIEYYYLCTAASDNEFDDHFESIPASHAKQITKVQLHVPDGLSNLFPKQPPSRTGPLQRRPQTIFQSQFRATFQNFPINTAVEKFSSALTSLMIVAFVEKWKLSARSVSSIVVNTATKDDITNCGLLAVTSSFRIKPTRRARKRLASTLCTSSQSSLTSDGLKKQRSSQFSSQNWRQNKCFIPPSTDLSKSETAPLSKAFDTDEERTCLVGSFCMILGYYECRSGITNKDLNTSASAGTDLLSSRRAEFVNSIYNYIEKDPTESITILEANKYIEKFHGFHLRNRKDKSLVGTLKQTKGEFILSLDLRIIAVDGSENVRKDSVVYIASLKELKDKTGKMTRLIQEKDYQESVGQRIIFTDADKETTKTIHDWRYKPSETAGRMLNNFLNCCFNRTISGSTLKATVRTVYEVVEYDRSQDKEK